MSEKTAKLLQDFKDALAKIETNDDLEKIRVEYI